jgi:hypothetical protein
MSLKKINNINIKKIELDQDNVNYTYKDIFDSNKYFNCALIGKSQAGKSNLLYNIVWGEYDKKNKKKSSLIQGIKKYPEFNTRVIIYSTNVEEDALYRKFTERLDKYEVNYKVIDNYNTIKNDLENMIKDMKTQKQLFMQFLEDKPKYKKINAYPLYLVIFDDFICTHPYMYDYMKLSRHEYCVNLICIQNFKKIYHSARDQLQYLIILDMSLKYLQEIYEEYFSNKTTFDEFYKIYCDVKKNNKYNFLFINTTNNKLRINFNYEIDFN